MFGWFASLFRRPKKPVVHAMPSTVVGGHHAMSVGTLVDILMDVPRTWQVECVRDGGAEVSQLAAVETVGKTIRLWSKPH